MFPDPNAMQKNERQDKSKLVKDREQQYVVPEDDAVYPQLEYTSVCNSDFLPLICNEFVTTYLDKNQRLMHLDRADAIDLTRNLCWWLTEYDLTCAHINICSNAQVN